MKYLISTIDRADKLLTLRNMTPSMLKAITLLVRPEQFSDYNNQWYSSKVKKIEKWDPKIDCLAKKRRFLAEHYRQDFTLIDDDLTLSAYDQKTGKYVTGKDQPKRLEREFLERFPEVFSRYGSTSIPLRFFAAQKAAALLEKQGNLESQGQLEFIFLGFKAKSIANTEHKTLVLADLHQALQSWQKTKSACCYYGMCLQQSSAKIYQTTGNGSYRTDIVKLDAGLKMLQLHPGLLLDFTFKPDQMGGGVNLKKNKIAMNSGVRSIDVKATNANLRLKLEELKLKTAPLPFTIEYDTPRQEIIRFIEARFNKLKRQA